MKTLLFVIISCAPLVASGADLYPNEWVQGMARSEIGTSHSPIDLSQPVLDVVPNGQTLRISEIFRRLNIDPKRVVLVGSERQMNVTFYVWKISSDYALSIMTNSFKARDSKEGLNLNSEGYGVRVIQMSIY